MNRTQIRFKRAKMRVDINVVISWSLSRCRKDECVLVDSVCRLPPNCVILENKVANFILPIKLDYQT